MPKVSVTIDTGRTYRKYKGDYVFVAVMNKDGKGNRWEQEPSNWEDGLGLFFTGLESIKAVAEQEGEERFKVAARAALDAMAAFDPASEKSVKKTKKKRATKKKTTKKTTKKKS